MVDTKRGDLQDGMLAHYLSQAGASDVNVEKRLAREPFDYREMLRQRKAAGGVSLPREFPLPPKDR